MILYFKGFFTIKNSQSAVVGLVLCFSKAVVSHLVFLSNLIQETETRVSYNISNRLSLFFTMVFLLIAEGTQMRISTLQMLPSLILAQQSNKMRKPIQEIIAKELRLEAQKHGQLSIDLQIHTQKNHEEKYPQENGDQSKFIMYWQLLQDCNPRSK